MDKLQRLSEDNKRLRQEMREIEAQNRELKKRISSISSKKEDIKNLFRELQNQHQQDCIRINDLTVTVNVLAGMLTNLRKTAGMD